MASNPKVYRCKHLVQDPSLEAHPEYEFTIRAKSTSVVKRLEACEKCGEDITASLKDDAEAPS